MLNYSVSGSSTPVIFLHGYMEDLSIWDFLKDIETIQAVAIDLNGHGASPLSYSEEEPSISRMAKQVGEIVEKLGLHHAQVVGHSLGGYVALELMKLYPELEHITFLHSQPWADSELKKKDRERVAEMVQTKAAAFINEAIPNLFHHPEEHTATIQRYCEIAKKMDPKAIAWSALAMKNREDNSKLMQDFPDRFTFIQGKYDKLISAKETSKFAADNGISYIELPESAHMGHEEETALCKEVLLSVLV